MRILRHFTEIPAALKGAVVAIGNFDGVHRGHQSILDHGAALARADGVPFAVLTFEPHPREFFAPKAPPFRLTPLRTKAHLLQDHGVDLLLALPFDAALSARSAEQFIDHVLVEGLHASRVVVGYDFAFGHKRGGNVTVLRRRAAEAGFAVTVIDPIRNGELVYSSTSIRDLLWQGQPAAAAELLGHWWEIEGRVRHGDQRGRLLGFPTANFAIDGYLEPAFGVYAVQILDSDQAGAAWHPGVANLGRRPTFGNTGVVLEVHVFDFTGDLYGRLMRIAFIDYLRPERKFDGLDALKRQIGADGTRARKLLGTAAGSITRYGV